jgi:hypothetical protein
MACALTAGRSLDCKDAVGGILRIGITPWAADRALTVASNEITGIAGTFEVFQFELPRNTGSYVDNIQVSVENGTVFYQQTLSIVLHKLAPADWNQIRLLIKNRLHVFIQDSNNNIFLMGHQKGAEVTAGSVNETGTATGDLNGYRLTFTAEEAIPAYHCDFDTDFNTSIEGLSVSPGVITLTPGA